MQYRRFFFLFCMVILPLQAGAEDSAGLPSLFSSMKHKMSYLGERQAVLSKNVANANTPGYQSRDLRPFKTSGADPTKRRLQMRATSPNHFSGGRGNKGKFDTIRNNDTFETTIAGNNVSLDEEMRKVAENSLDYQATTNLYKKWAGVMRTAVTGSKQ